MLSGLRSEDGTSLTELVLTMAIGMVTVLVTMTLVVDSQSAANRVTQRVDATQRGRTALEQVLQVLRAQVCLTPGTPTILDGQAGSIRFLADLTVQQPLVPEIRQLRLSGDSLVEDRWIGTGAAPATVFAAQPRSRVVTSGIDHPSGSDQAVFRYFALDGTGVAGRYTRLATPLSPADRQRVVKIGVEFRARGAAQGQDVPLASAVVVRTADVNNPSAGASCA